MERLLFEADADVIGWTVKLVEKIVANPSEAKFRRLKTTSDLFRVRFGKGIALLEVIGFARDGDLYVLRDDAKLGEFLTLAERRLNDDEVFEESEDDDDDDQRDLARAVAMSVEPSSAFHHQNETTAAPQDDDQDLARAVAMSVEPREVPSPVKKKKNINENGGAPTTKDDDDGDDESRFRSFFEAGLRRGLAPNAAAAKALEDMAKAEKKTEPGGSSSLSKKEPPADSSSSSSKKEVPADSSSDERPAFERMGTVENVSEDAMEAINLLYREDGVVFVDPSFPPAPGSLFEDPRDADRWSCAACRFKNPIPPGAKSREGVLRMLDRRRRGVQEEATCSRCGAAHPLLEVGMRPTDWLRPQDVRDDLTMQTSTVPWVVFRGEPRADDLRQGGVGNCWFVCALSVIADKAPRLLEQLLSRPWAYNPAGAYQVRLNLGGIWRVVTVDDSLPVNALDNAAYLKPARRSLWPPLIEKAAAKLHGSYEALNGGTFAEAFAMLTGFPVKRLLLDEYRPEGAAKFFGGGASGAKGGASPPPATSLKERKEEAEHKARKAFETRFPGGDAEAALELFAQLYSLQESGFLVGASTFVQGDDELEAHMRSLGLQTRHAYGVLDARHFEGEPLVKLRNPNGVAGWRGAWSREDRSRWTPDAIALLAPDREDGGVFWMRVSDLASYFVELTVCRLLPDRVEARTSGWLASAFGPGEAVAVEAYARTALDVALYQEPHKKRGRGAATTAVDLGMALVKIHDDFGGGEHDEKNGDDDHQGQGGGGHHEEKRKPFFKKKKVSVVASCRRQIQNAGASCDGVLELDAYAAKYVVVPLCFGHVHSREPRKFVAALHSSSPLAIETVPLDAELQARAVVALAMKHGERTVQLPRPPSHLGDALVYYATTEDEAGYTVVAENLTSDVYFVAELALEGDGVTWTRSEVPGSSQDVLPPRTRVVIGVFSKRYSPADENNAAKDSEANNGFSLSFGARALDQPPGADYPTHFPSLDHLGDLAKLHEPIPIPDDDPNAPPVSFLVPNPNHHGGGGGGGQQHRPPQDSLSADDLAAALRGAFGGGGTG